MGTAPRNTTEEGMPQRDHFMKLARDVGLFTAVQRTHMDASCTNQPALVYDAVVAAALSKNGGNTVGSSSYDATKVLQNLE
jgi:hypothetical protein